MILRSSSWTDLAMVECECTTQEGINDTMMIFLRELAGTIKAEPEVRVLDINFSQEESLMALMRMLRKGSFFCCSISCMNLRAEFCLKVSTSTRCRTSFSLGVSRKMSSTYRA